MFIHLRWFVCSLDAVDIPDDVRWFSHQTLMSIHSSWLKHHKNCVWTIIAWKRSSLFQESNLHESISLLDFGLLPQFAVIILTTHWFYLVLGNLLWTPDPLYVYSLGVDLLSYKGGMVPIFSNDFFLRGHSNWFFSWTLAFEIFSPKKGHQFCSDFLRPTPPPIH